MFSFKSPHAFGAIAYCDNSPFSFPGFVFDNQPFSFPADFNHNPFVFQVFYKIKPFVLQVLLFVTNGFVFQVF